MRNRNRTRARGGGSRVPITNAQAIAFLAIIAPQSYNRQLAIQNLFIDAGDWIANNVDYLWITLGDAASSVVNVTGNAAYNGTLTGTVNFLPSSGFKGDGATFWSDSNMLPGVGTKFQQNNASFGTFMSDPMIGTSVDRFLMGFFASGTLGKGHLTHGAVANSSTTNFRINNSALQASSRTLAPTHWYLSRDNSSTYKVYANGILFATFTASSLTLVSSTISHHARKRPDLGPTNMDSYNTVRQAYYFAGAKFDNDDQAKRVYHAFNRYGAAIGTESLDPYPPASVSVAISPQNPNILSVITYTLTLTSDDKRGGFDIVQSGDFTDSDFNTPFKTSLAAAVAATTGITFDGNKRLTYSEGAPITLTWQQTLTSLGGNGNVISVELSNPNKLRLIMPVATSLTGTPPLVSMPMLRGVNISGPEFSSSALYPSNSDINYYLTREANVIRLPMKWARMQPTIYGNLDITGSGTGAAEKYKAVVDYIISQNCYCIIDLHEFGSRDVNGTAYKVGDDNLPVSTLIDFWRKIISYLGNSQYHIYDFMNEPVGLPTWAPWSNIAKTILDAVRAQKKFNLVHVFGSTNASTFVSSGSAALFANFSDPANNYTIDLHQYLDTAGNGLSNACVVGSGSRADAAIAWAQGFTPKKKLHFGEFAAGYPSQQPQCGTELPALLNKFESSLDVVFGYSAWGGGPFWGTYMFALQPTPSTNPDTEYMNIVQPYWALN